MIWKWKRQRPFQFSAVRFCVRILGFLIYPIHLRPLHTLLDWVRYCYSLCRDCWQEFFEILIHSIHFATIPKCDATATAVDDDDDERKLNIPIHVRPSMPGHPNNMVFMMRLCIMLRFGNKRQTFKELQAPRAHPLGGWANTTQKNRTFLTYLIL